MERYQVPNFDDPRKKGFSFLNVNRKLLLWEHVHLHLSRLSSGDSPAWLDIPPLVHHYTFMAGEGRQRRDGKEEQRRRLQLAGIIVAYR